MDILHGAKIICDFRKNDICTKEEGERLLAFTNNSGPLFIIGTVGTSLFCDTRTGFLLLFTHILACITVGFIFRFWKKNSISHFEQKKLDNLPSVTLNFSNFGEILGKSILNSINTLLLIGGFIVFFSVIISIIKSSNILNMLYPICKYLNINFDFVNSIILGLIEITNGIQIISKIPSFSLSINIILCSFLLGFGGISVLLQVSSIISKSDISIKPYILGKILHGFLASFYTFLFLKYSNIFNLDFNSTLKFNTTFIVILFFIVLLILLVLLFKAKLFHIQAKAD